MTVDKLGHDLYLVIDVVSYPQIAIVKYFQRRNIWPKYRLMQLYNGGSPPAGLRIQDLLKIPHGADLAELVPLWPAFLSYVLSFIYIGIYWNNHHHLMHAVKQISGRILWYNMALLFWLSLFPFATGWMGENHFAAIPTALYGGVLLMAAVSYHLLVRALIRHHGKASELAQAFGRDIKGLVSIALYAIGIVLSLVYSWVGFAFYVAVALTWFIPDRRVERGD